MLPSKRTSWEPESTGVWRNADGFLRTRSGTVAFITKAWLENYLTLFLQLCLTVGFLMIISCIIGKVTCLFWAWFNTSEIFKVLLQASISRSFSFFLFGLNINNNNTVWFGLPTPCSIHYCCLSNMSRERESKQRLVIILFTPREYPFKIGIIPFVQISFAIELISQTSNPFLL